MKRWLCLTSVLLLACQTEATEFVGYPAVSSDIVALYISALDGSQRADAVSVDALVPLKAVPGEVRLLEYTTGLEGLGLTPGPLSTEVPRSCHLLDPDVSWRSRKLESGAFDWAYAAPSDGNLDLLVPDRAVRCTRCIDFDYERVPADGLGRGSAALLDSGAVYFSSVGASLRIVERQTQPVSGCSNYRSWKATLPLGGNRFLGGTAAGDLVEFHVDEDQNRCEADDATHTFVPAPDPPLARPPDPSEGPAIARRMARRTVGGQVETFAGMSDGRLMHLSSAGWTELGRLDLHPRDGTTSDSVGLVVFDDGDAAFSAGSDQVGFLENGVFRVETVPGITTPDPKNANRVSTLAYVEGLGLLLGTGTGQVRRREGSGWTPWLQFAGAPDRVGAIAPYPDGLVATVDGGRLYHWHEDRGLCDEPTPVPGSAGGRGRNLLVHDRRVLVGDFAGSQEMIGGVDWFDPR